VKEGSDGKPEERENISDKMVSPIDEDARYGAKSATKKFMGYKASITESVEKHFITNVDLMAGNRHDADPMVKMVIEQKLNGLLPKKLIGDTAYSNGICRKLLNDNGTKIVAPLRPQVNAATLKVFPKSMFTFDAKTQTLTCPQGVKTSNFFQDQRHMLKQFHFPMSVCKNCSAKAQCTNAGEGRRTVGISIFNKELREAEIYNTTDEFKTDMKLRPPIEGKLSELTRYHGLRRARYRGLIKVQLQGYFTAAVVNIKRWIKLILEGLAGKSEVAMGF
jgi:transposase